MISTRHWLIAGGLAVSVHTGAFFAVFYNPTPEEGSQDVGSQGIEFGLGMDGDLGVAAHTTAFQEDVKEVEEERESIEEPEAVESEPMVDPEPIQEPEVVEPDSIVEPEVIEEPDVIEPEVVEPDIIEEPEIVEPEIVKSEPVEAKQTSPIKVKQPDPKPTKVIEKPKVVKPPEVIKEKAVVKVTPKVEPKSKVITTPKAKPRSVAPPSVANQKATTGTANSASNGGNPGAKASYLTQLTSILARNKKYPRASRRRNEEGVVSLTFLVHKDGKVTGVSITKSSGYKRLDKAVLDMIKRSTPLPIFSKDMVENEIRINLPVSFKLSDLQ